MAAAAGLTGSYREAVASRWFEELPDPVRHHIAACSRVRSLAAGAYVYRRGEFSDGLYRVLDGTVKVCGNSKEGRETILDIYAANIWFGETSALIHAPRIHDAIALEPARVLHLPEHDLDRLLAAHPELSLALVRLEAARLQLLLTALESYSAQSMEQRVANRLLLLAHAHGARTEEGLLLRVPLSQETLARLVGTTRQRVGQILGSWESRGIVVHRRCTLVLCRVDELESLARL